MWHAAPSRRSILLLVHLLIDAAAVSNFEFMRPRSKSIKLEAQGEHTAESHVQDKVSKFLTVQQSSALEQNGFY